MNGMTSDTCWFVYIIETVDGFYYTGITTDPLRRYREHRSGGSKASRYLRAHVPRRLVFYQKIGSRSLALKVEYHLKQASRTEKRNIITSGTLLFHPSSGRLR